MVQDVTGDQEDLRCVLVRSGSLSCALPAADVVRVLRGLICYPVPGSRARLLGLAQYGGEPLPVLDLHAVVEGDPSGTRHRSTVILGRGRRRDRHVLGLAVDEVVRVVDLSKAPAVDGETGLVVDSVVDGEKVKVLNTGRLLTETMADSGAVDV
jgi:chemotaxis signal transduction protein